MEALDGPFQVIILINLFYFYRKYSTHSHIFQECIFLFQFYYDIEIKTLMLFTIPHLNYILLVIFDIGYLEFRF